MAQWIYVGNFGAVWRLTPAQWRDVCRSGAGGEGYDLSPYRQLRRSPRFLRQTGSEVRGSHDFWCTVPGVAYHEPLDWTPEEFAELLAEDSPLQGRA